MNRCPPRCLVGLAALPLVLWAIAGGANPISAAETQLTVGSRELSLAPLGPPNLWPHFRFQIHAQPVTASAELSAEDRAGMFADAAVPPLPYLIQDNYTRQRRDGRLPTVVLENANLRATFYPTLGGRMISLYDKPTARELLFDNPVLQFANLAIRNAWFSGGVEWNGPLYGHSLLTCSPVFAGLVETPRGPLLRLYEFDRALETTWQVDLFLPAGDDRLWVHVRAVNPQDHDVRFYWWTNIAVPLARETRVLSPADYTLSHDAKGNMRLAFPKFDGFDGSYPARYPYSKSVFFRKPGQHAPWSVCVDGQGSGICHVSTATLFGRKFFTWGTGRGGRRWMEFLSQPGQGDYIEIQGGVTPTQLQDRLFPAGTSLQWTECLSPFAMQARAAHDPDYPAACTAASRIIQQRVPDEALQEIDAFLTAQAATPVARLLHRGAGWGWLYEKRTGRRISPGLTFEPNLGDEERPWSELLAVGTFSAETLGRPPCSFNVSEGWKQVLGDSARAHGATWLHDLHLGVIQLEHGRFAEARDHFRSSIQRQENALAQRCLALLAERDGDLGAAQAAYQRAWALAASDPNLAVEMGDFFMNHQRSAEWEAFAKALPAALADHERIALQRARLALQRGDYDGVRRLLQRPYCTIREGELSLSELWFDSYIKPAEAGATRPLTSAETEALKHRFPPPECIDFRMK